MNIERGDRSMNPLLPLLIFAVTMIIFLATALTIANGDLAMLRCHAGGNTIATCAEIIGE